jgi:hypothetical protein
MRTRLDIPTVKANPRSHECVSDLGTPEIPTELLINRQPSWQIFYGIRQTNRPDRYHEKEYGRSQREPRDRDKDAQKSIKEADKATIHAPIDGTAAPYINVRLSRAVG